MLVPDASAVLRALVVDGLEGESVRVLLEGHAPLHAPHLLDLKVLSGLRGLVLGGKVDARRAQQAHADFWDLPISRHPTARCRSESESCDTT